MYHLNQFGKKSSRSGVLHNAIQPKYTECMHQTSWRGECPYIRSMPWLYCFLLWYNIAYVHVVCSLDEWGHDSQASDAQSCTRRVFGLCPPMSERQGAGIYMTCPSRLFALSARYQQCHLAWITSRNSVFVVRYVQSHIGIWNIPCISVNVVKTSTFVWSHIGSSTLVAHCDTEQHDMYRGVWGCCTDNVPACK